MGGGEAGHDHLVGFAMVIIDGGDREADEHPVRGVDGDGQGDPVGGEGLPRRDPGHGVFVGEGDQGLANVLLEIRGGDNIRIVLRLFKNKYSYGKRHINRNSK